MLCCVGNEGTDTQVAEDQRDKSAKTILQNMCWKMLSIIPLSQDGHCFIHQSEDGLCCCCCHHTDACLAWHMDLIVLVFRGSLYKTHFYYLNSAKTKFKATLNCCFGQYSLTLLATFLERQVQRTLYIIINQGTELPVKI